MVRTLQKVGNSRCLVLNRTMLEHLGIRDNAVDVSLEEGRIVLRAPTMPAPGRPKSFEEAAEAVFEQYPETMRALASLPEDR
jgi:antitoxin component of MazEF toxin-antitoxin module